MTLTALLAHATQRLLFADIPAADARTEARLLVQHAFGLTREQLILRPDTTLDSKVLEPLLLRRARREPLAYILGERGFYGLSFHVTPAVLIPRPETELLVETVLEFLPPPASHHSATRVPSGCGSAKGGIGEIPPPFAARNERSAVPSGCPGGEPQRAGGGKNVGGGKARERQILDIGTGSGCIAVTLAKLLPEAQVWATDISETALDVARENAARHGVIVEFCLGDLLAPLPPALRFEVIVSNPPYIAPADAETLEPEVGVFEPHLALFDPISGSDGLTLYRRLASEAPARLTEGGWLMVEVGQGQAEAVAQLFADAGLTKIEVREDLAGIPRVVLGQKNGLDRVSGPLIKISVSDGNKVR